MIKLNASELRREIEIRDSRFYSIREMATDSGLSEPTIKKLMYDEAIIIETRSLGKLAHFFQKKRLVIQVGDFFRWEGEELLLNIGSLMARLDPIPTSHDVARFTNIKREIIEQLMWARMRRIRLSYLWLFLKYFRSKGLEIKLGDLLLEEEAVSHFDENNHQRSETMIKADQKRQDSEYLACVESVPIIRVNIIALKNRLIAKKGKTYSNSRISEGAKIHHYTFEKMMKGDITWRHLSTMGKLAHYFQSEGLVINVGDFFRWEGKKLVLNIGSLMTSLDPIPTSQEVHDETGISLLRIERSVRGNAKRVNFRDLGALLLFFRKRGLDIKLGDLLREEGAQPRKFCENGEGVVRLAEERQALEIAGKMLSLGMDVAQIATVTDLNLEQIKALAL